jgi:hypothetical protein
MADMGRPPKTGWAKLVPELLVSDIGASLAFWRDQLGFAIAYERPEQRFAYLERPEGAQIMLCQRSGNWETAPFDRPYGRGVMLQAMLPTLNQSSIRSELQAGLSMLAHAMSGARSAIEKRGNAKSSSRIRMDI